MVAVAGMVWRGQVVWRGVLPGILSQFIGQSVILFFTCRAVIKSKYVFQINVVNVNFCQVGFSAYTYAFSSLSSIINSGFGEFFRIRYVLPLAL